MDLTGIQRWIEEKMPRLDRSRVSRGLAVALPLVISAVCMAVLASLRSLDFEGLARFLRSPIFWAAMFVTHQMCTWLTTLRWRILLSAQSDSAPPLGRLFLISWATQFVALLPVGPVVTEMTRFGYMFKGLGMGASASARTVLWDRVYGFAGLVFLLGILFLSIHAGATALILGLPLYFIERRALLLLAISALVHVLKAGLILFLIVGLPVTEVTLILRQGLETMLGLLAEALPLSWNGLGLGHLAFEIQSPGRGAEVFNVFFTGKLAFNFLGVVPFLWSVYFFARRKK